MSILLYFLFFLILFSISYCPVCYCFCSCNILTLLWQKNLPFCGTLKDFWFWFCYMSNWVFCVYVCTHIVCNWNGDCEWCFMMMVQMFWQNIFFLFFFFYFFLIFFFLIQTKIKVKTKVDIWLVCFSSFSQHEMRSHDWSDALRSCVINVSELVLYTQRHLLYMMFIFILIVLFYLFYTYK